MSHLCFPNSLTLIPAWVLRRINDLFSGEEVSFCQRLGVWYIPAPGEVEWVKVIDQGLSLVVISPSPNQPTEPVSRELFESLWLHHFGLPLHPLAARLIAGAKSIHPKYPEDGDTLWSLDKDSVSFVIGFDLEDRKKGSYCWNVHLPVGAKEQIEVPLTEYWLNSREALDGLLIKWLVKGNPYCCLEVALTAEGVRASAIFGGERRPS